MLAALERAHGIGRARVTSIRRVQNIRLWTKFQLRRHEVLEQAGGVPWGVRSGFEPKCMTSAESHQPCTMPHNRVKRQTPMTLGLHCWQGLRQNHERECRILTARSRVIAINTMRKDPLAETFIMPDTLPAQTLPMCQREPRRRRRAERALPVPWLRPGDAGHHHARGLRRPRQQHGRRLGSRRVLCLEQPLLAALLGQGAHASPYQLPTADGVSGSLHRHTPFSYRMSPIRLPALSKPDVIKKWL